MPSLSAQDLAHGVCEAADMVDPVMPDPATVGGPDVGDLIDQAYIWQQSVPYGGFGGGQPLFEALVRAPIFVAKVFKDFLSAPLNIVCQQTQKQGPYYELFPLDQKMQAVKDAWVSMGIRQKVVTVSSTALVLLIVTALLVK